LKVTGQNHSVYNVHDTVACLNIERNNSWNVPLNVSRSFLVELTFVVLANGARTITVFHQERLAALILQFKLEKGVIRFKVNFHNILESEFREVVEIVSVIEIVKKMLEGRIAWYKYRRAV